MRTFRTRMIAAALFVAAAAQAQPAAVDMGLSVKWASCNLGATAPHESGDYFAWGETQQKQTYDRNTYAFNGDGPYGFVKYNERFILNRQLDAEDDVVQARLGGGWRTPTFTEANELVHECDWTWTESDGVQGYRIESRKNGNSIFLPAAGYMEGDELNYHGTDGRYWTATRHPYHPQCAMNIFFSEAFYYAYFYDRFRGYPVRPVCE